jgi:hypothetical protein
LLFPAYGSWTFLLHTFRNFDLCFVAVGVIQEKNWVTWTGY